MASESAASVIDARLYRRYLFFREHAGYSVPPGRVASAWAYAKAERDARAADIRFAWEYDSDAAWEDKAPRYMCSAYITHEVIDSETGRTIETHEVLASCGGIDVDCGPYIEVMQAELGHEALTRMWR